jgi:hypothetical protein
MERDGVLGPVPPHALSNFILEVVPLPLFSHFPKGCNPGGFRHNQPVTIIAIRRENDFRTGQPCCGYKSASIKYKDNGAHQNGGQSRLICICDGGQGLKVKGEHWPPLWTNDQLSDTTNQGGWRRLADAL